MTKKPLVCEASAQCDTHIIDAKDKKYEWNEWNMRRYALRMVNLRNKKTTSSQTHESHFKRDNSTQVYEPRDSSVQTTRETGTSFPTKIPYLK